ncbi:MAG TPA: DMT family transporter [Thermohalobaculum sp.]|nr:DMT family transporter [Thermohalobaculum sp.]
MARPASLGLAIGLSLLALLLFDAMGLIIKMLSPRYGAAELSAWRNVFGLIPSLIVLWSSAEWRAKGRVIRIRQWPLACFRGIAVTFAQLMFYLSLGRIDFATATTISYAMALFTPALSVLLLHERVGAVRWASVVIGFAGVMMVVGLGRDTFSLDALLPLGAAFLYALTGVTVRMVDGEVPSALLNLYSSAFAVIGSVAVALFAGGFTPIASGTDFLWIVAMGGFGGSAVLFLVISYRMTEPSNLAPFNYFGIPMAFVLGWMFFGEQPFDDLFPGVILIVAGGLMIVWRERQLHNRRKAVAGK